MGAGLSLVELHARSYTIRSATGIITRVFGHAYGNIENFSSSNSKSRRAKRKGVDR